MVINAWCLSDYTFVHENGYEISTNTTQISLSSVGRFIRKQIFCIQRNNLKSLSITNDQSRQNIWGKLNAKIIGQLWIINQIRFY